MFNRKPPKRVTDKRSSPKGPEPKRSVQSPASNKMSLTNCCLPKESRTQPTSPNGPTNQMPEVNWHRLCGTLLSSQSSDAHRLNPFQDLARGNPSILPIISALSNRRFRDSLSWSRAPSISSWISARAYPSIRSRSCFDVSRGLVQSCGERWSPWPSSVLRISFPSSATG